jgi:orotate phosphoribosyltransferase
MGGVIAGHEMGRALGLDAMFSNGPTARSSCAAAFAAPGTGADDGGCRHHRPVVARSDRGDQAAGGEVIAAAALVDRSNGKADLGVPFFR